MKVSIVDCIVLEFNNIEERDSAETILAKMNASYCISPVKDKFIIYVGEVDLRMLATLRRKLSKERIQASRV